MFVNKQSLQAFFIVELEGTELFAVGIGLVAMQLNLLFFVVLLKPLGLDWTT